jgi:hypothetical protein
MNCKMCGKPLRAKTSMSTMSVFARPIPSSGISGLSLPKPKPRPTGITQITDALALGGEPKGAPKDSAWSEEKRVRGYKGISVKTRAARKHLGKKATDRGSKMLAARRDTAPPGVPVNDSPRFLKSSANWGYRHRNCAMCTMAAIQGDNSTATLVVLNRQVDCGLFLDPSMHQEKLWLLTQASREQASTGLARKKLLKVLPRSYDEPDPWKQNRRETTAQLGGLLEYLLNIARDTIGVNLLVVRQGYPDLDPADRRLFPSGTGDPLGEMYPTEGTGKGSLLGIMNEYPNGTRFAVFLFGTGGSIGAMHWVYAERYMDKIVFEDYQKNLYISSTDYWPAPAYVDEIPHHPVSNNAGAFTDGMFLALVPVYKAPKKFKRDLKHAVLAHKPTRGTRKVSEPNYYTSAPIQWPPLDVSTAKATLTDEMIAAVNATVPMLFQRLEVTRKPVKLVRDRTVFELETEKMGLAIMYMENEEGLMAESARGELWPVLRRGYEQFSTNQAPVGPNRKAQIKTVLEDLWSQDGYRPQVIQHLQTNGQGVYWTADKLYPGKCGANIAFPGRKGAFLWRNYTVTQDMYYYTVLHEFMHLEAKRRNGMNDWNLAGNTHLRSGFTTETAKDGLRSTFDEGLTDLFADLLCYRLRKHSAFRAAPPKPPRRQGYRTYDYQRRAMYLAARRVDTTHTRPGHLHTYVGVKMFARALFDNKFAWLHKSIKAADETRLDLPFLRRLSQLRLEGSAYARSGSSLTAVTALGLPAPKKLSLTNDPGRDFQSYFWHTNWRDRLGKY